ncbi:MAG: rRNA maturation RNase YbeY [Chloroflexota bacterium]|nr:rRNA maturation RNase YbeY [Chloroflexota bacterium]
MDSQGSEWTVEVQIAPQFARLVDADLVRRAAIATLAHEEATGRGEVSLVITDDEEIHDLNRRFRGVDAPTDVLAFGVEGEDAAFVTAPEAPVLLGDVIISCPRAQEQAVEADHPLSAEIQLLVVHGVLHLLGHDHAQTEEKAAMWARQEEILRALQ